MKIQRNNLYIIQRKTSINMQLNFQQKLITGIFLKIGTSVITRTKFLYIFQTRKKDKSQIRTQINWVTMGFM